MADLLQIAGALMILGAYAAGQAHMVDHKAYLYLLPNLAGSAILAVLAYDERQWGFLLLEGVWALITAWSLAGRLRETRGG